MTGRPVVAVVRCDAEAEDEVVAEQLLCAAEHLGDVGRLFAGKRKVLVKVNLGIADVRLHRGRQVALTDKAVAGATVRLIRRHYSGEIIVGDATTDGPCARVCQMVGLDEALAPYDVRQVELNDPPYAEFSVPDQPLMFSSYLFSAELADVDAVVSVAKMKSHVSTGATLCLKNLFGLPPVGIYGRPRRYLHAPIRLPRVLADEGLIFRPCLNVIDGLVAQDQREWRGPAVDMGLLLVGDNVVATDATAMRLMGMDPVLDYGHFPFYFDANPVKLAADAGLGPIRADEIDVRGDELGGLTKQFHVARARTSEVDLVRRSVAAQAQVYLERRDELLRTSSGKMVVLANGEVICTADSVDEVPRRAELAEALRDSPAAGVFLKRVLPPEEENERLDVYQAVLDGRA